MNQPDEALLAQGRASAQGAAAFERLGLPFMPGLAEALATPGARMLDVGTGVAALAASYAELFPQLTVVGIDTFPRVLALAEDLLRTSAVADRVELREQDVSELSDEAAFALAWLPAPFVPQDALRAGVPRIVRSLVPGGWLILGHGKLAEDPLDDALTRFKTVSYGGTPLSDAQAQSLLERAGLDQVRTVPTPEGAPAITVGRRAPASCDHATICEPTREAVADEAVLIDRATSEPERPSTTLRCMRATSGDSGDASNHALTCTDEVTRRS